MSSAKILRGNVIVYIFTRRSKPIFWGGGGGGGGEILQTDHMKR